MARAVPEQDAGQRNLPQVLRPSPFNPAWWATQDITNIPPDQVGWLVAQGWRPVNITYDATTNPPTAYYAMTREGLQNANILQSMLIEYTDAYNLAGFNNSIRYNDILASWDMMLETSHDQFEGQFLEQTEHTTLFLGDLTTYMNEVDGLVDLNQSQLLLDAAPATDALTEMDTKLDDLVPNYDATRATIDALIVDQSGYLTTFLSDYAAGLTALDTNYTAHLALVVAELTTADTDLATFVADQATQLAAISAALTTFDVDFQAELANLTPEYDMHAALAPSYLDNLGATELARINEEFAASLSAQLQQLTDRGLYTSAIAAAVTARNTRDRDEQIQMLNDRLNRERLENQHTLYGQQVNMRGQMLSGVDRLHEATQAINTRLIEEAARLQQTQLQIAQFNTSTRDRLLEQLQQVETQQLAGIDRQNVAQQDVSRTHMAEYERLLAAQQDACQGVIAGLQAYSSQTMQNSSTLSEHKHRAIVEKMNEAQQRLAGLQQKHEECIRMMAYQLDERNKILVGLYEFVERRDDIPPSFEALTQIAVGLGDAGGGWVTP